MTSRKEFLAASSLFALAPSVAQAASPQPKASAPAPELTFTFDRARFDEILAKPAQHKQCFGITKIAGGAGLDGMNNSIEAYQSFLKEGPGSMHAVGVLYHGASIGFALSDEVWNEYLIPSFKAAPEVIRKDAAEAKPGKGNPFLRSSANVDVSVQSLVAKGANFFVCHNAIVGFSQMAAGPLKQTPQKVHDTIMAGIVPGALVVPAGVMAVNAAQEAKFTYIQATL